jgi:hypothetical protein
MRSSPRDNLQELLRRSIEAGRSLPHLDKSELDALRTELLGQSAIGRERVEDLLEEVRARTQRGFEAVVGRIRTEIRNEIRNEITRESKKRADDIVGLVGLVDQGVDALGGLFSQFFGDRPSAEDDTAPSSEEPGTTSSVTPEETPPAPPHVPRARKAAGPHTSAPRAPRPESDRPSGSPRPKTRRPKPNDDA